MSQEPMKIINLKATNVLNLKAVEITPKGDVVVLTGANEAGKSSVLDSICMALTGKSCGRPIRNGEEKGEVVIDTGRFTIRKVWTHKNARLEVYKTEENGLKAQFQSPQALLNDIIGSLSFDPLSFKLKSDKDQRAILVEAVNLDVSDLDKKRAELYEDRKLQNKQVKLLEGNFALKPVPPADAPEAEVSVSDLLSQLEDLNMRRAEHEEWSADIETAKSESITIAQEIERLKSELKEAEKRLKEAEDEVSNLEDQQPDNPSDEAIENVRAQITTAESVNEAYREVQTYKAEKAKIESEKAEAKKLDEKIKAVEEQRIKRITECKFPVPGLSVDDECVLFDGTPFSQLSTGRQIRVSTAIAMALNPTLKVLFVRDASLLDEKGLKAIVEQADGYQLWLEKVDTSGRVGIYIEEGEIKAVNQ